MLEQTISGKQAEDIFEQALPLSDAFRHHQMKQVYKQAMTALALHGHADGNDLSPTPSTLWSIFYNSFRSFLLTPMLRANVYYLYIHRQNYIETIIYRSGMGGAIADAGVECQVPHG